jgi:transcriptional regulator of acetoin/glycerol metabolism
MQYNQEKNNYTYSYQDGHIQTLYYNESNEIIIEHCYNILEYKMSSGLHNAFKRNKLKSYVSILWEQLPSIRLIKKLYKDVRAVNRNNLINEYNRLKKEYNIDITHSHFDSMIFNDPFVFCEYNINEFSKGRQNQIKSKMFTAKKEVDKSIKNEYLWCDSSSSSESESEDDDKINI